jgi:hypothetical protein
MVLLRHPSQTTSRSFRFVSFCCGGYISALALARARQYHPATRPHGATTVITKMEQ